MINRSPGRSSAASATSAAQTPPRPERSASLRAAQPQPQLPSRTNEMHARPVSSADAAPMTTIANRTSARRVTSNVAGGAKVIPRDKSSVLAPAMFKRSPLARDRRLRGLPMHLHAGAPARAAPSEKLPFHLRGESSRYQRASHHRAKPFMVKTRSIGSRTIACESRGRTSAAAATIAALQLF